MLKKVQRVVSIGYSGRQVLSIVDDMTVVTYTRHALFPGSSNGRTPGSGPGYLGSNPGPGAKDLDRTATVRDKSFVCRLDSKGLSDRTTSSEDESRSLPVRPADRSQKIFLTERRGWLLSFDLSLPETRDNRLPEISLGWCFVYRRSWCWCGYGRSNYLRSWWRRRHWHVGHENA